MASSPITSWQIDGDKVESVTDFIFLGFKITVNGDCSHKIKTLATWEKSYDKPRQHIKKSRHHFANKGPSSQMYSFFSSHVHMWELDNREGWELKNWCFQIVVLEKIESLLNCKEIKPINSKGNHPEYSLEGLLLKLQYFGCLMWRANLLEKKSLMLEEIEGNRRGG